MITPEERKWIETQLQQNGLKGASAQKFTNECIYAFGKKRKQPRKSDFVKVNMLDVLPGYKEYLNTQK